MGWVPRIPGLFFDSSHAWTSNTWILVTDRQRIGGMLRHLPLAVSLVALVAFLPAQNPTGALAGREIVISPGHGYYWHSSLGWTTQRGEIDGLIEDIHTHEIVHDHLLPYLERSGARTILCRARSRSPEEHVIQNDDGFPAYAETGSWFTSGSSGMGGTTYRYATTSPTGGATASFTTTITTTGHYPVYVGYRGSSNRTTAARIEIAHAAGTSWRTVDQTRFDRRWLYVGTFPFRAFEPATVTVTSQSTAAGVVISDAVKIGDGDGVIPRGGGTSGQAQWRECSRYHAEWFGAPATVWNSIATGQDNSDDVSCRPRFGEWYANGLADLYLSLHTNAGGGTGTSSFIHDTSPTAGSAAWQSTLHNRVINDIRSFWDPSWIDRGQMSANFGEVRHLQTMPGCLIELAFHDDLGGDIEALHHPRFRRISGRAMGRAIMEYLAPGMPLLVDPPDAISMRNTFGGTLSVSWNTVSGATSYLVRISEDGFAFDDGTVVTGTTHTISGLSHGTVRYARVAAVNASGTGPDSEPVGARSAPGGVAPLLVVNGFDRRDRYVKEHENPLHWVTVDGAAIDAVVAAGYPFDSATNESVAVFHTPLAGYECVGWILGEESTADETFSSLEQIRVNLYLLGGGRLFFTGAEVGWDLDLNGTANDRLFYNQALGQDYVADDAGVYTTQASAGGPLGVLPAMTFDDGSNGIYDVDWPDVVQPAAGTGGQIVLRYATGTGAAVLHGNGRTLGVGFPLEALVDPAHRALLMERILALMCPLPVRPQGTPTIGSTLTVDLDFPSSPGAAYVAGAAFTTDPAIVLADGRSIPLTLDPLLLFSLNPLQTLFTGMTGVLDPQGQGAFQVALPNDPSLVGFSPVFSALTLDISGAVGEISPWVRVTVN
ncbi:MAG: hypothetical protein CL910_10470 [Deltaproteobacteria bacterium]|nr:hypothetical protein [Deltaproteobacteria bacterium]